MLVLSRKEDERILIGDNIRITIVSVSGNQVRVGIEAPAEIQIRREELQALTAKPVGPTPTRPAHLPRYELPRNPPISRPGR